MKNRVLDTILIASMLSGCTLGDKVINTPEPQTSTSQTTDLQSANPFKPITNVYEGIGVADFRTIPFETAELIAYHQAREMLIQKICGRTNTDQILFEELNLVQEGEIVEKNLWVRLYLNKVDVDKRIKYICPQ